MIAKIRALIIAQTLILAFVLAGCQSAQPGPAKKSAELYAQYLTQAGNRDFEIVVFPGVGHSLGNLMPAYWARLSDWLKRRAE